MKKILFLTTVVLSLIVLIGAGCVSFRIEEREAVSMPTKEPTALPEANVNREIPSVENINVPIDETAGWETYRDEPWAIEMKYPPKYKTVHDTYGWPHALIHFIEVDGAQSYRAHIETWDNEDDFRSTYGKDPAFIVEHPNGKNWVTIDYNSDPLNPEVAEEWRLIISTFRFISP